MTGAVGGGAGASVLVSVNRGTELEEDDGDPAAGAGITFDVAGDKELVFGIEGSTEFAAELVAFGRAASVVPSCELAGGGGDLVRVVADGLGLIDSLDTVTSVLGFLNSGIDDGISCLEADTEVVAGEMLVGAPPACVELAFSAFEDVA